MCRSTSLLHPPSHTPNGTTINIKALFVHVRTSSYFNNSLPQFLTILFNNNPPNHDSLSLHRLHNNPLPHAIFANKLGILRQPLTFQLFLGEVMLLKGELVKGQDKNMWMLDCTEPQHHVIQSCSSHHPISEVQICFAFDDGNLAVTNWVRVVNIKERVESYCVGEYKLEKIPEEVEDCFEGCDEVLDLEGVRRTVDYGIWILCLGVAGVGYVVSKASARKFRRPFLNI